MRAMICQYIEADHYYYLSSLLSHITFLTSLSRTALQAQRHTLNQRLRKKVTKTTKGLLKTV